MKTRIYLSDRQDKQSLSTDQKKLIRSAVRATLRYEHFGRDCEVSITLVDDEAIRVLNAEHRGIDRPTDVLSFPMFDEDFDDGEYAVLGDVVISLERAYRQAAEYGHSPEREIAFLVVHSILHLLGYDHEAGKAEESEMFQKQEEILQKMGISR